MIAEGMNRAICRRQFWQRTLLGVAAAALGLKQARAQKTFKMTQKQAGYIVRSKPATQICAQCIYFVAPRDCVIVEGPISPLGWCTYYGD